MKGARHLPLAVLLVMLMVAAAAMGIGWLLAREERVEVVEKSQDEVVKFAGLLGREIKNLEENLDRTLLDLCQTVEVGASDRSVRELAATYAGVRQVASVKTGRLGKGFQFERAVNVEDDFPLPIIGSEGEGELRLKRLESPGVSYFWAKGKGG